MTYSRREHIEAADAAKWAMAEASLAMKHAAWATWALTVPVVLTALGVLPKVLLTPLCAVWGWFAGQAGYRLVRAHLRLRKLDRMNREAP